MEARSWLGNVFGLGGAVERLMRGLAVDLKPLRVNVVSPGAVNTELFSSFPKESLDKILEFTGAQAPPGAWARRRTWLKHISIS